MELGWSRMDLLMALMLILNLILESLSNCALKKIELYGCTMDNSSKFKKFGAIALQAKMFILA